MNYVRACWRLVRVLQHIVGAVWMVHVQMPRSTPARGQELIQAWSRTALALLAIDFVASGDIPQQGPVLLVANHVSWLDIVVMNAARHSRFISKADVQRWPLLGSLAKGGGTLFIERESRRDAMRVVHHMVEHLRSGEILAVFPEGTTGDGTTVKPFHANLLQAPISANVPVQPVAIRYVDIASGLRSFAPCYVDDDTLVQSLWRTLCASGVRVEVTFGTPEMPAGRDRRTWAADLQSTVAGMCGFKASDAA
jgi:1-acyl-sn-glycerol-3-phosphate acyltransferase